MRCSYSLRRLDAVPRVQHSFSTQRLRRDYGREGCIWRHAIHRRLCSSTDAPLPSTLSSSSPTPVWILAFEKTSLCSLAVLGCWDAAITVWHTPHTHTHILHLHRFATPIPSHLHLFEFLASDLYAVYLCPSLFRFPFLLLSSCFLTQSLFPLL